MQNLPTRNKNPGDLKDPKTGTFRVFPDSQSGFDALKNDLQGKITGNTRTGLNGNSTLLDFASKYAPSSDNNDPTQYAKNLAKKLGVSPATPIGKLSDRLDDFASAIADNEGYQGQRVSASSESVPKAKEIPTRLTQDQLKANIDAMEAQGAPHDVVQSYLDSLKDTPGDSSGSASGDGYVRTAVLPAVPSTTQPEKKPGLIQSVVQGVANPFLQGASSVGALFDRFTGDTEGAKNIENNGADYGYFGKAKPIGAGFDITKPISENVSPLLSAAGTGAQAGSELATATSLAGGIKGLLGGATKLTGPLAAPEIEYNIPTTIEKFAKLGTTEKLNMLGEAYKTAEAGDAIKIAQAMKYLSPSKAPSIVSKLVSSGVSMAKGAILYKVFGDTIGSVIHKSTGN